MERGGNLVSQNISSPAVSNGRGRVPVTELDSIELVEKEHEVAPGQLASRLLANCIAVGPAPSEQAHVLEIAGRKALHLGKFSTEIVRELCDGFSLVLTKLHECAKVDATTARSII